MTTSHEPLVLDEESGTLVPTAVLKARIRDRRRTRDPKKKALYSKRYRERHPDRIRARTRKWKASRRGKVLMRLEDYERMKSAQGNTCAVCERGGELLIDHDHDTKKIRGLLCRRCNGIAQSLQIVKMVLAYMERYRS